MVKIEKIEDFDFFSGLKDDLWDIKKLSSLTVFRGFMASDDIDFVEFQKLKNEMSKIVILVIW